MFAKGLINTDNEINLKMPKAEKKIKRETLSPEVFDKILYQVPNSTSGRRDKAMLSLLSCTKISISELVSIDIDSFNKRTREIKLKSGIVILPYNAFAYLLDYLDNSRKLLLLDKSPVKTLFLNCNGSPLSRQGFWKTVKKYIKMAKIGDSVTLQNLKSLKL
jgi:integrase/recombinase XerD